jgi:hypothetical protein
MSPKVDLTLVAQEICAQNSLLFSRHVGNGEFKQTFLIENKFGQK